MEQLVNSLTSKLNLGPNCTIKEVLILLVKEKSVLHSSGIDSPTDRAQQVWRLWQSATELTDVAADHLIQIKVGAEQKMVYENHPSLERSSVINRMFSIENLRFESAKRTAGNLDSVSDIVQVDPTFEELIDTPTMGGPTTHHQESAIINEAMRESLRKAPSRLHDRPVKTAIQKANLEAVQSLKQDQWRKMCLANAVALAFETKKVCHLNQMAGRPWYIQAMDVTHRLTVLGILGGSGYLTFVAFKGIQHNKAQKELKQATAAAQEPEQPTQ